VSTWSSPGHPGHKVTQQRICIFDGFLLYNRAMANLQPLIDIKLFLRVSYAKAKARREARSGYVTLEGFWEDPPGYVDKIVWPNYVQDHAFLFNDGDVEGSMSEAAKAESGIKCQDGPADADMETTLRWAVETVMKDLEKIEI
jgi:nicotinamide/nicotinate riboside kinase